MQKILLHCCCAPCTVSCLEPMRNEGIEPTLFWYNPNIHPFKEYEARRDCMVDFANQSNAKLLIKEDYGLKEFVKNTSDNIDDRCIYCYTHRLRETAKFARDNGFEAFTSTLLASIYQNHETIVSAAKKFSREFGIKFLYRDFRPNFRDGNAKAREIGLYMQKYCGCIFSEQDRYQKQIDKAKEKYNTF